MTPTETQATTTASPGNDKDTMKSILVSEFAPNIKQGECNVISMGESEKPKLDGKNDLIVRVLACSISPGDAMMLRGNAIFMHPSKFPYIPGMDICGTVEQVGSNVTKFKKGDTVVASNGMDPVGGMAEFMKVSADNAVLKPPSVSVLDAASSSSAITALQAVDYVKQGDRVLILGGSGGVGSAAITLAKKVAGASLVVTTSTQNDLCKRLGADVVINYNESNWWEMKEFQEAKFDKIIDTVGGGNFTDKATLVLKTRSNGGRFLAVTGDDPVPDATTWWKAIKFFANLPMRPLYTWLRGGSYPGYIFLLPSEENTGREKILKLMEDGTLAIQLDPSSPLPFTQDGVTDAFKTVGSGHAHGKVVVSIQKM